MLIEVESLEEPHSVVILLDDWVVKQFSNEVPFESLAIAWKHEVYLSTPVELGLEDVELSSKVMPGYAYYWPPEKSLCMFYGLTHAYTPVAKVGMIIDPLHRVPGLAGEYREECRVRVKEHSVDPGLEAIVSRLRARGYVVATPLDEGVRVIAVAKELGGGLGRASAVIYVEEYGAHVEGDAIAYYGNSLTDAAIFEGLRRVVELRSKGFARLDLTEDNYVAVTAGVSDHALIPDAVDDVLNAETAARRALREAGPPTHIR